MQVLPAVFTRRKEKFQMTATFKPSLNYDNFLQRGGIAPGTDMEAEARELFDAVARIGSPKCAYREFEAQADDTGAIIGGRRFTSRVLGRNLSGITRVFATICTCGAEVDEASLAEGDELRGWWLDVLKTQLLMNARDGVVREIDRAFKPETLAAMAPGSGDLDTWRIEEQRPLFDLFDGEERAIGVTLTPSFLMVPNKTTSGILYPSESGFRTCQVCHRENCPNRTDPFDPAAWSQLHGD